MDRITHPLRLAAGSHQPGSGKGCAMNVISYINGDTKITDFPACSAKPLARLVQDLNDRMAGPDGFLSPRDSMTVLDLGWLTVGTADTSHMVVWQWFADLFVDPEHGVARYASDGVAEAIRGVGGLCMRKANGECVSSHEWRHARIAAAAAAYAAADVDAYAAADAAAYAYAAAYAAAAKDAAAYAYAAAYAAAAADPAADPAAAAAADAYARIDFVRWAIQRWRQLAQLDTPTEIPATAVNDAVARIGGQA